MRKQILDFVRDENGMEMIEWTIVATVFAVAAAAFWGQLGGAINTALQTVAATVGGGSGN
ncbi:MAG: hypothetical protein HKP30_15110 [Myxococcales bacterium]|nr:hypothetical protein [Myxococcales bacterium]